MTREPITDPEVLADLRLRESSERDRTRSSLVTCECGHHVRSHPGGGCCEECGCDEYARAAKPWNPFAVEDDAIVEHWPCRGGCNTMIGVTAATVENLALANRKLAARREVPIGKHQVCPDCKCRDEQLAAMQRQASDRRRGTT